MKAFLTTFFFSAIVVTACIALFLGLKELGKERTAYNRRKEIRAQLDLKFEYAPVFHRQGSNVCVGMGTLACGKTAYFADNLDFILRKDGTLQKLIVRMGTKEAIIDVSDSLPENDCRYNTVLKKETARLLLAREALARNEKRIRRRLRKRLNKLDDVFRQSDYYDLTAIVQKEMKNVEETRAKKEKKFDETNAKIFHLDQCSSNEAVVLDKFKKFLGL